MYTIVTLVKSDVTGMLESRISGNQIFIMFPVIVLLCVIIWTWILRKFSKRIRNPNCKMSFPGLKNSLSESPLEWIFMLALFFIVLSISLELGILLGHGQLYGIGFLGIAYGLGLIGSIVLILQKKRKGL